MNEEQAHTFEEACAETVRMSVERNQLMYLYKYKIGNSKWGISHRHWDDWLFKAYPGGRKVLSLKGKEEGNG